MRGGGIQTGEIPLPEEDNNGDGANRGEDDDDVVSSMSIAAQVSLLL